MIIKLHLPIGHHKLIIIYHLQNWSNYIYIINFYKEYLKLYYAILKKFV